MAAIRPSTTPFGFVGFTLNGCPNGQATVALTFEGANGLSASTFRKHGPTTPGGAPAVFYSLAELNPVAGVSVSGNTVSFTLSDGGIGDDTAEDGQIVDQGGPGFPGVQPVPAMSAPAVLLSLIALCLVAAGSLGRGHRVATAHKQRSMD